MRLVVAVTACALLYSAFWLIIATRALDSLETWAERQQQAGYTVRWDGVEMSGYPFRLVALLDQPRASATGKWAWSSGAVTLSGRPWLWNTLRLDAPGLHTLTVFENGVAAEQSTTLDAGTFSIEADFLEGEWRQMGTAGSDLRVAEGARVIAELARFSGALTRETIAEADERTRTASIRVDLSDLDIQILARNLIQATGSVVRFASLDVEIYGPLPGDLTPPALTAWRDAGGVAEVRRVRADYGPLGLDADGTLALDGQLQPVGSFVARLDGFSETVDALHGANIISDGNALTAKLVLGVMAKRDGATGWKRLSLAVNLQDRTLYAGPLAMVKLPIIQW